MEMNEKDAIKDPILLKKSLFVLILVLTGFVFHGMLHFQPATVALFGAGLLLLLSGTHEPHHILSEVEWPSIFFFMGLFIIIGGVVKVGLITWMSMEVLKITRGNLFTTSMIVMWFSAFASAFIDNIPYVATMNPLIVDMAKQLWPTLSGAQLLHHIDLMPLWWSLALGACLGGNGTAIGASANVIVVGMSEKMGKKISFGRFMLYGMPLMAMTVAVATLYVWLRYYVLKI
jgi:Na+/H+ antiporter NhaD/arsenite permease-like protein